MAVRDQRARLHPVRLASKTSQPICASRPWRTPRHGGNWSGRQGETLLALGLAQRLHDLQKLPPDQLSQALSRREALLRLVDPAGLGEFRWWLFGRGELLADFSLAGCSDKPGFAPG